MSAVPRAGRTGRAAAVAIPLLLGALMLPFSVLLGSDASWDLRNYHLYDAWAALHKPDLFDLVPAQLQSFNAPAVDLPALWLRFRLNGHPEWLAALLAVPSAVAVALAWCIGRTVVPADGWAARMALLLAILLGASGAAGAPTTGTSMSEMPAACPALAGLLLLLHALGRHPPGRRLLAAGLLFGVAAALKLTLALPALSALAALLACSAAAPARRIGGAASLAAGMLAGLLLAGLPWWWHLARLTGNPLFPYYNDLFRSVLLPPESFADTRFLPRSFPEALAFPFLWGFTHRHVGCELALRDPRLAVALIAGLCCLLPRRGGAPASPEPGRPGAALLVFCALDAVLWESRFSILRYLAPIELLCGLPVLLAVRRHAHLLDRSPLVPLLAMATILLGCASTTIYPNWGRVPATDRFAVSVSPPPLPPHAMVLLLTGDAMSYVAAFVPPQVRFVGINNNLLHPGDRFPLARMVEATVRAQRGPLFGLEVPGTDGQADAALRFYGLRREMPCQAVRTSLEADDLRLCRLRPAPAIAARPAPIPAVPPGAATSRAAASPPAP